MNAMVRGGPGCPAFRKPVADGHHKVVLVRAASLRPLEPPETYKQVPRRVLGDDGQIRGTS
jgi:hypothetical protein